MSETESAYNSKVEIKNINTSREEVRKNLNRRRAGNKVKSLDPYRNDNSNTENPKVIKKLELQDTKASFNNREEEQIDSSSSVLKSARDSIYIRKRKLEQKAVNISRMGLPPPTPGRK